MKRLKLTISYDGSRWLGWQSQPGGKTVQDQIEAALKFFAKTDISLHGSGRTDAGVHALAQIAHCDVPESPSMGAMNWLRALNTHLPRTIRIMDSEFVDDDFHARFSAKAKVYRYRICRGSVLTPFEFGRAWHVFGDVDLEALRACGQALLGTHNFARLCAFRGDAKEAATRGDPAATTRTIYRVDVHEDGESLEIEFEGNGFLYKMVRMLTGAMIHVGRGGGAMAEFEKLLSDPTGIKNRQCAPADGLYLVRVVY